MALVQSMVRRSWSPPSGLFSCAREVEITPAREGNVVKSTCQDDDCAEIGCHRCHDCMIVLCGKHTAQHRTAPDTCGHSIESQEMITKKLPHCHLHPEQMEPGKVFYCHFCERVACRQCTCETSGHPTGPLADVAQSRRRSLHDLTEENRAIIKTDLAAYLDQVQGSLRAVGNTEAKLKAEVNRFYDAQVLAINQERRRLLGQVETVAAIQSHAMTNKVEWVQTILASARSTLEFTSRALEIAGDAELLAMYGPLSSRLDSLKEISHGVSKDNNMAEQFQVDFVVHQQAKEIFHNLLSRQGMASLRERLPGENVTRSDV